MALPSRLTRPQEAADSAGRAARPSSFPDRDRRAGLAAGHEHLTSDRRRIAAGIRDSGLQKTSFDAADALTRCLHDRYAADDWVTVATGHLAVKPRTAAG